MGLKGKMFMLSLNPKIITKYWLLLLVFIVMAGGVIEVKGQTSNIYATYVGPPPANTGGNAGAGGAAGALGSVGAIGTYSIVNPTYINDTDYSNYAELKATSGRNGSGLGGGDGQPSNAYINLNFTAAITPKAGTSIIIKVKAPAIDKVQIQAYNNTTAVGSPQFLSALAVKAADEYVFVSTADCNAIRITTNTGSGTALGGGVSTNNAFVYYAYILDPTCNPPVYTATRKTAILDLGSSITNEANAIDGNLNSFSFFSNGLGVGTTLYQTVYFSQPSPAGSVATLTLSIPPAALSAGVLGYINVNTYNGSTLVSNTAFSGLLLGTDLLNLLNSGGKTTISISTPSAFDRIELAASSLVSLATSINLYEVQITPAKPTFSSPAVQNVSSCSGNQVTLTPNAPGSGNELRWYSSLTATTPLHTGNMYSPSPTSTTTYFVATAKTGCIAESERVPATVTVNPLPTASISGTTSVCQSATSPSITFTGANGTAPYTFTYNINGGSNTTITTTTGNTVSLSVPTATAGTFNYNLVSVKESSATQCSNSQTGTATVVINPKPIHPITSISSN